MGIKSVNRESAYLIAVGIVGIALGLLYVPALLRESIFLSLFLFSLAVFLDATPVPIGKSLGSLSISLPVAAMVIYGQAEAIWIMIAAGLISPHIPKPARWSVSFFNAGQYAISVYAMVTVYHALYASTAASLFDWQMMFALLVACAAFIVVNHLAIHMLQIVRGQFAWSDIKDTFYADSLNFLISLPFSLVMIALSPDHPLFAPVSVLPVVMLAHILRVHRKTTEMQKVHAVTARLASEFDIDTISEVVAKTSRELLYADASVVYLLDPKRRVLMPNTVTPNDARDNINPDGIPESGGGVIWQVIYEDGWVYVPDARKDNRVKWVNQERNMKKPYLCMAIFPLQSRGEIHGAIVCYSTRTHAFSDRTDYITSLAAQVSVLLENAKLYQALNERSIRDGATGLYNYRYFYEELEKRVRRSVLGGPPCSISVIDVDYFKKFNDTYGHLAGDEVLKSIGRLLSDLAGADAVVARYGGEEFSMLLPLPAEETVQIMEHIRTAVAHHVVEYEGYRLQGITVSVGIASCPEHGNNDRDLLLKADSAMYWGAKQRGRNRVALYTPEFDAQLFVDELTGLYTFHLMNIRIREEFTAGITGWGAISIDLEHFNYVNNAFGFSVGDKVLQETSILIKECLRHGELACRYGGDEFLILLPSVNYAEMSVIAERIAKAVSSNRFECGQNVVLSLRIKYFVRIWSNVTDAADLFDHVGSLFAELHQVTDQTFA